MKQLFLLILSVIISLAVNAQDIILNFNAINDDHQIDYIVLKNITQNETVVINNPSEPFNFSQAFLGIGDQVSDRISNQMNIYPNPGNGSATLSVISDCSQNGVLNVFGFDGKLIISQEVRLISGISNIDLSLADAGLFIVVLRTKNDVFSTKYFSNGQGVSINRIQSVTYEQNTDRTNKSVYGKTGDYVLLEAHSGEYKTLITDQVFDSKSYWFTFFDCIDVDNNYYSTVQIGTQWWMAENLKTTSYNDGTIIPLVENNVDWTQLSDNNGEGMSWYSNSLQLGDFYGGLYTFNSATKNSNPDSNQGICPDGWRVPSQSDWESLVEYLTSVENEIAPATVLKSTESWINLQSTNNKYGFSALPAGFRYSTDGTFDGLNEYATWWTTEQSDENNALVTAIDHMNTDIIYATSDKTNGKSIRCIKNGGNGIVLDGFYIVGPAAGEFSYALETMMTVARNEVFQEDRPELHELFMTLRADAGFNIVRVSGSIIESYGPGDDFELIMNPGQDEPDAGSFWRGSAQQTSEMFTVPEDGFYHIVYDEEVNVVVIAKANWGMIGSATPYGWSKDTVMVYHGFDHDSAVFEIDSILLREWDFKYRYSSGWKIEIDTTGPNSGDYIKINTNLGKDGDELIPGEMNIPVDEQGLYNVKLIWDRTNKRFVDELTKIDDYYFDYSDVDLGLIGDGLIVNDIQWIWEIGWQTHLPTINDNVYTWTWESVQVSTEGSFKLREGDDWSGYSFGYSQVVMAGDAADDFESNFDFNFVPLVDQIVNITFTIDATTDVKTFTVNTAK